MSEEKEDVKDYLFRRVKELESEIKGLTRTILERDNQIEILQQEIADNKEEEEEDEEEEGL